tara:strand:- start:115 stop:726 length:612 start_codon:yes stop_codon:yes gene_type:complete
MKSLSEIETVSKRASKAAGYTWGEAEEVGKNIRLLEMFGFQGIKNLNGYLKKKKISSYKILKSITKNNNLVNAQFCPIIAGISFLDQIRTLEEFKEIRIKNIAYPLLFLPFASRASEVLGKRLLLKFDDNEFLFNFNNNIYSNFLKNEVIKIGNNISIKFLDNSDSFHQDEWEELYKLSEETFVEENENSKLTSAGAGLNDND